MNDYYSLYWCKVDHPDPYTPTRQHVGITPDGGLHTYQGWYVYSQQSTESCGESRGHWQEDNLPLHVTCHMLCVLVVFMQASGDAAGGKQGSSIAKALEDSTPQQVGEPARGMAVT